MPEELENQNSRMIDVRRFADIIRRRHILFLTLLLLGWAAVWGGSFLMHSRYTSSTLILVEPPSIRNNYVVPNVADNFQEQIQSITEQIMSRTRLQSIIDKRGLYNDNRHPLTPDERVERMRKDIDVELVRDSSRRSITAFRIFYTAGNAHLAQQVTRDLTTLFINENLSTRQQQSQDTTHFLREQLRTARSDLARQDAKVREFETVHAGSLPSQQASNLQILSGLQSRLQSEQDALNTARQQRAYHQSIIDQYQALDRTSAAAGSAPADLTAIDQRLNSLWAKLADLRTRYTDRYPGVQELKAEIARTQKNRQALVASLNEPDNKSTQSQSAQIPIAADPSMRGTLLQMQGQLKADEIEITNRENTIATLRSKIGDYQARLNEQPAVAQQLTDLTRGYQQSQQNYDDLLKKANDSQLATNMEQIQKGERFTIIDPPSLPLNPDYPNRLKMCGIGSAVGLVLGLLVVGLLEVFDDRMHDDKQIKDILPEVALFEIPEILIPEEEKRNRRRIFLGWAMTGTVMIVILASAAFSYLGI